MLVEVAPAFLCVWNQMLFRKIQMILCPQDFYTYTLDDSVCYIMIVDMVLGSFLVPPCALTSCHIVISKQGDGSVSGRPVKQVCNRKETTWYENPTVRLRESVQWESRVEWGIHSRSEALVSSLTIWLARGCKHWHPWLQEEDMRREEVPSLSICLSIYLSNLPQTVWPFRE